MALSILLITLSLSLLYSDSSAATFTIANNCNYPIWPGILSSAGTAQLPTTGFILQPSESSPLTLPAAWSGRLWARTLCTTDPSSNKFSCLTGDCGSGTLECSGGGASPPATLAEFTLNGAESKDFYDVSLVDGYNLPMLITPQGGDGNCTVTGCVVELNGACPSELKVMDAQNGRSVACKSACDAFGDPQFCCSGAFGTPETCKPSTYSEFFKNACPRAYSYAYDDGTSTFTCSSGSDYVVTFCPSSTPSVKSASDRPEAAQASAAAYETSASLVWVSVVAMAVVCRFRCLL
ncbi:Thaumatin-like protein 1 [Linum perenne]